MKPWPSDMFFMYGINVVVWMANDVPVEMFKKDSERAKFKKDKTSERSWFKKSLYKQKDQWYPNEKEVYTFSNKKGKNTNKHTNFLKLNSDFAWIQPTIAIMYHCHNKLLIY